MSRYFLTLLFLFTLALASCSGAQIAPEPIFDMESGDTGGIVSPADVPLMERSFETFEESRVSQDLALSPSDQERIVLKNADLSMVVGDPSRSMNAIANMADEMGGFVVNSNLFFRQLENGLEVPQAQITIRVPAERLDEALERIELGAGRILSKNISGQDVTREYTDLKSRLRNLQEAETQLREIMDSATKTEDVLTIHNQLVNVREQIEVIQGQIQYFEQSAAFSLVSVELLADEAVQPLTIGGWQPAGVAKSALQALITTLKGIAYAAIWLVLFFIPVALVLLIPAGLIWRGIKRLRDKRKKTPATDNTER